MSPDIAKFTPSLFWDVDLETLDLQKNKALIIQRVLERGHDKDWALLKTCYTIPEIVQTAKQFRALEATALAFAACIGNAEKEEFRCFTWKQSAPTHWPCFGSWGERNLQPDLESCEPLFGQAEPHACSSMTSMRSKLIL